jgi:hypothetical protein
LQGGPGCGGAITKYKVNGGEQNCSGSIDARIKDFAARAASMKRFKEGFNLRMNTYTKYKRCVVCDIVANGNGMTQHGNCRENQKKKWKTCKSCLSSRHDIKNCQAKKHKTLAWTCRYCLLSSEYHMDSDFAQCPTERNDLLWDTVFLMMAHRNMEFRSILQSDMGFKQGAGHGDVAKQEDVAKFLGEYKSENGHVNGFMEFFTKWDSKGKGW